MHLSLSTIFYIIQFYNLNHNIYGNTLGVQWLELYAFAAKGVGSIAGHGTKILQATWPK